MKVIIILFMFLVSISLKAGFYTCLTPNGRPEDKSKPLNLEAISSTKAFSKPFINEPSLRSYLKKPFLIYYAIDTEEPFMQFSVRYEIARLRQECERTKQVNFISFLNSDYTSPGNFFRICKDGLYTEIPFSQHPKLAKALEAKRMEMSKGSHISGNPGTFEYLVNYKEDNNIVFYNYPLSHPDFLYTILSFVRKETKFFPSEDWTSFMNLKSHGNSMVVLSGLHPCQLEAKTRSQEEALKEHLSEEEIAQLKSADYFSKIGPVSDLLQKLNLGESTLAKKLSNYLGESNLGEANLGEANLGEANLSTVAGLGIENGLGANFTAGVYHIHLSSILAKIYESVDKNVLGFLFLESCDSNRRMSNHQKFINGNISIYSAKDSLWYRNLNWWEIMNETSSFGIIQNLNELVSKVPNFKYEEKLETE